MIILNKSLTIRKAFSFFSSSVCTAWPGYVSEFSGSRCCQWEPPALWQEWRPPHVLYQHPRAPVHYHELTGRPAARAGPAHCPDSWQVVWAWSLKEYPLPSGKLSCWDLAHGRARGIVSSSSSHFILEKNRDPESCLGGGCMCAGPIPWSSGLMTPTSLLAAVHTSARGPWIVCSSQASFSLSPDT